MLPKPDGGTRPIGLFPAAIRLWMRARAPSLRRWESQHNPDEIFGSGDRTAIRAAWLVGFEAEAANGEKDFYTQGLLDLVKAFEQVVLAQVWNCGLTHGIPKRLLVLSLEACAFTRRLKYRGAVSEPASTCTAILARSGRATDLLLVALIDAVHDLMKEHEARATRTTLRSFMI